MDENFTNNKNNNNFITTSRNSINNILQANIADLKEQIKQIHQNFKNLVLSLEEYSL